MTEGYYLPTRQKDTAPKASLREKDIAEDQPGFCSENIAHFIKIIQTSIDKCLVSQRLDSFIY